MGRQRAGRKLRRLLERDGGAGVRKTHAAARLWVPSGVRHAV
jgi:hypothetical protein